VTLAVGFRVRLVVSRHAQVRKLDVGRRGGGRRRDPVYGLWVLLAVLAYDGPQLITIPDACRRHDGLI
jgi:hypothetical protein